MSLKVVILLLLVGALFFGTESNALAMPLATYRERIGTAANALDALELVYEEAGGFGRFAKAPRRDVRATLPATEKWALSTLRSALPPSERIEWAGGAVDVDNGWLDKELQNYERLSSSLDRDRAAFLSRLVERLRALDDRLAEAEHALRTGARDKEAEKGQLAAILRQPEFNEKASQGGALRWLVEQIIKWLRALFPRMKPLAPSTANNISRLAQILVYVLAVAVMALVIWKFGPRIWRPSTLSRITPGEARIILGESLAPEQTATDLLAEAERLARAGETRGAIRKAYIALLCELGDRKILRLAQHKTNRDYLRAIERTRAPLYREMQPLTASFERHWYGLEAATGEDWTAFRARCRQALSAI